MGHGETFTFQDCEEQLVPKSIGVPSHQPNVNLGWIEFYDNVDHKIGVPSRELTYIDTFESMIFPLSHQESISKFHRVDNTWTILMRIPGPSTMILE